MKKAPSLNSTLWISIERFQKNCGEIPLILLVHSHLFTNK